MNARNLDKKLIEKFKAGKCSPDEVRKILLWYESEEAETSFSFELENYWNEDDEIPFFEKDHVYKQITKKIEGNESHPIKNRAAVQSPAVLLKRHGLYRHTKLMVVFVLLLLSVSLFYFKSEIFTAQTGEAKVNWVTMETTFGQKYTIKLPDGTTVKLNSGSRIHYPEVFSDSLRLVEFEGEAFFEVVKDPLKPFVIKSGSINTMVLGTSFNIQTRKAAKSFELAVVTGSVKVSHYLKGQRKEERFINPNQSAVLDHEDTTFHIQEFDPLRVLAWVDGTIVFENSSFDEIVQTLEAWYGVQFDRSSLKRKMPQGYTGKYKDKSLETVLQGISFVLDFKYEIKGKKVIIK